MVKRQRAKRGMWTEQNLRAAMAEVEKGELTRVAAERHGIPRRTLAYHMKTGSIHKRFGRGSVMNDAQEMGFISRILRLANSGLPLTMEIICREAYAFCEKYKIKHNFNADQGMAGKDWLNGFLRRHPEFLIENEDL